MNEEGFTHYNNYSNTFSKTINIYPTRMFLVENGSGIENVLIKNNGAAYAQ